MINKVSTLAVVLCCGQALATPEPPVIDRDIHMAENRQYLKPTIPTLQTSFDGRVGIGHRVEPNEQTNTGRIAFRLQVPEKIDRPFLTDDRQSRRGSFILSMPNAIAGPAAGLIPNGSRQEVGGDNQSHAGLCDPTGDPNYAGRKNPYACGADDCYDLTIIRAEKNGNSHTVFGTPVTVQVTNPKTANAEITQVTAGTPVRGSTFGFSQFFEPVVTNDGRLLMLRAGQTGSFSWRNNAGVSRNSTSDNVYLVNDNPAAQTACDVRQWDQARPLMHAPYDNTINERYGFAMQMFRDPQGNVLAEDQLIGSYPWIDKDGDNVTFTAVGTSLFNNSGYQHECVPGVGCSPEEEVSLINGRVMMGLWTRGKMVLLDNMTNNSDFPLAHRESAHRNVRLYEDGGSAAEYARVGDVRSRAFDEMPLSSSGNSSFFDSNEHRFNYNPNMKPVTPADVVWTMSSGRSTDEVQFDDFLNPNSFINSNMAQTITINANGSRGTRQGTVQNAGTATRNDWIVPAFATILGDGRYEPIAKGGFRGKGYWLSGENSGLRYNIAAQPQNILNSSWYYGLFVDTRNNNGQRSLLSFPDNSEIRVNGANQLVFINSAGTTVRTVNTVQNLTLNAWSHIAFQLSNRNRTVTTLINGYRVDSFTHSASLFQLTPGNLLVGQSTRNVSEFRGWIDDVKVFAQDVNAEVSCNLAAGTLAAVTNAAPAQWRTLANNLPNSAHNAITTTLANSRAVAGHTINTYNDYVCYHDYSDDLAANLSNIPNGMVGIRDDINFPEGPLYVNRPRPESRTNAFCTSCHTADGNDGLDLDAIALNPNVNAPSDPRRQPMQPDARVFGNIPAGWLGNRNHFVANNNGYLIDNLLLDSSNGNVSNPAPTATPVIVVTPTPAATATPVVVVTPTPAATATPVIVVTPTPAVATPTPTPTTTPVTSNPDNLLVNPSFESGNTGWNTPDNATVVTNNAQSGSRAAYVNGNGGFNQQVTLDANSEYTLTVYGRVGGNDQAFWVGVTNQTASSFITNTQFTSTGYTQRTITFETSNVDGDVYSIWMWNNQGGQYYTDNYVLTKTSETTPVAVPTPVVTPEPATPVTGERIDLATDATNSSASSNWQSATFMRLFDGILSGEARADVSGIDDAVWVEFTFARASNLQFRINEDNRPSFEVSRWSVQAFENGQWVNIVPWTASNTNTWVDVNIATNVSAERIRVFFEAPDGQRVGVRDFQVTGITQ